MSFKSGSECHKCTCQDTPTVKDIYAMMQMQNDQIKFLLETIQKLLATVLSNQQSQHKCCYFEKEHYKQDDHLKTTELIKNTETETKECQSQNSNSNLTDKPQASLKIDKSMQEKNELNKSSKCVNKPDVKSKTSATKDKLRNPLVTQCGNDKNEQDLSKEKEKEKTYSIARYLR